MPMILELILHRFGYENMLVPKLVLISISGPLHLRHTNIDQNSQAAYIWHTNGKHGVSEAADRTRSRACRQDKFRSKNWRAARRPRRPKPNAAPISKPRRKTFGYKMIGQP
jgi:hypothetical protein